MFAAINAFLTRAISGYFLNKSLRFRGSASAYLNRTASASISTFTVSMWVKRGSLTSNFQYFFSYNNSGNTDGYGLAFNQTTDTLYYYNGTAQATTAAYRDPAAWYHIVFSNNAGAFTLYVNGVSVKTGTATAIPSSSVMNLGRYGFSSTFYFDGELAEINFVDGQALAPTSFGAFSTYNQWLPIKYAGTYGTNGFYLPFNSVSTSSYAGSFNGTSQYLTVPANAAFALGATSTIEMWLYATSSATQRIINNYQAGLGFDVLLLSGLLYVSGAGANATATFPLNTWTHLAVVYTSGTLTIYFNGVAQTLTGTTTGYNFTATGPVYIGSNVGTSQFFSGYISNLRVVKGTAVYTANFVPPTAALTAITNTSLLTLQNATIVDNSTNAFTITNVGTVVTSVQYPFTLAIAADSSGNANNWTPNNISLTAGSTYDSLTDVPTLTSTTVANYAVLNPLDKSPSLTISNGNLTQYTTATTYQYGVRSSIRVSSGKWYWETFIVNRTSGIIVGINGTSLPMGENDNAFAATPSYGYNSVNGNKFVNGVSSAYGASYTSSAVIGIALDMDAGTLTFYKDNVSQGTAATGISGSFAACNATWNSELNANFGQQPFTYTPPSGFLPLNTFNI